MIKLLISLLVCWLLAGSVGAEQVNLILKSGKIEQGNIIKTTKNKVSLEGERGNREYAIDDIEAIFKEETKEVIDLSELWKYHARNSVTFNMLSSLLRWHTAEFEYVINPSYSFALRAGVNMQGAHPVPGGGLSLRFYPGRRAPSSWYTGGRADIYGDYISILFLKFETGYKHYFKNGITIGYFLDLGAPISLRSDADTQFYLLYAVGVGLTVGYSF